MQLFIWCETRAAAAATVASNLFTAIAIPWMHSRLGYVKLLGLPHILVWTPFAWYLWHVVKWASMPLWPRRSMMVVLATLLGALAFDTVDVVRHVLGKRLPIVGTLVD